MFVFHKIKATKIQAANIKTNHHTTTFTRLTFLTRRR